MLTELCDELNNWFTEDKYKFIGTFVIRDGVFMPPIPIEDEQYIRIVGSLYNDGVHRQGKILKDEIFEGAVWLMRIPAKVIELASTIEDYNRKYDDFLSSPYISESFGGYSYSKITNKNGHPASWRDAFSSQLNRWRKV